MSLLSLKNLGKTFETPHSVIHAVRNVSLDINEGECLAIVGESGSGKTTLANMVLGILPKTSGEIFLNAIPLNSRRSLTECRTIQLVQQNPLSSLNPRRSVGASIRLGLDIHNIGARKNRWKIVEDILQSVGLPANILKRTPSALSGGQRQRVGIARALVCNPRILILDEPTSSLDVLVQARVLKLLKLLQTERNLTYIFITHDLAVARNIADRVAVFKSGELIELGTTHQIFSTPCASYTRKLIGDIPVVTVDELKLRNRLAKIK